MTAKQLQTIRVKMGLSQAKLAGILAVQANTVARWEQGVHPIAPAMARMIEILSKDEALVEALAKKKGGRG